jgi:hypothetical protein
MNMNLNTQQLVLLCLLVAFVTSITTGITVVSLMDDTQAPVSQTINRVVERTIERVVEPEEENKTVTKTPAIIVDRNLINQKGDYIARTNLGDIPVDILSSDEGSFSVLQLKDGQTGLVSGEWGDSNSLQLGQSVISISGSSGNTISSGIINKLDSSEKTEGDNTWNEVTKIYTGVDGNNVLVGSIITNLQGKIVGFKNFSPESLKTTFTPANVVKGFLDSRGN